MMSTAVDYDSDQDESIVIDGHDPYERLGQKLAAKTLEYVLSDREERKAFVLNLKPKFGVEATKEEFARWWNRRTVYRTASDNETSSDQPPSMETIERFLVTIINNTVAEGINKCRESGVPSIEWLQRGLHAVIVGLRFRHQNWRPAANAIYRFRSIMRQLRTDEKLINEEYANCTVDKNCTVNKKCTVN